MMAAEDGRADEARERFSRALAADPAEDAKLLALASLLASRGRMAEARLYLELFARQAPPALFARELEQVRAVLGRPRPRRHGTDRIEADGDRDAATRVGERLLRRVAARRDAVARRGDPGPGPGRSTSGWQPPSGASRRARPRSPRATTVRPSAKASWRSGAWKRPRDGSTGHATPSAARHSPPPMPDWRRQHLAMALIELGESQRSGHTHDPPRDPERRATWAIRRLLAQALIVAGRPGEALQELEDARAVAPDDLETLYVLAAGNLRMKKLEQADELFARARAPAAARSDPRADRAHVPGLRRVRARPRRAAQGPRTRPAGAPGPLLSGHGGRDRGPRLARRGDRGVPGGAAASRPTILRPTSRWDSRWSWPGATRRRCRRCARPSCWQPPQASAFHFLGRCLVALERPAEAKPALDAGARARAALRAARTRSCATSTTSSGLALRQLGQGGKAAAAFRRGRAPDGAHRRRRPREPRPLPPRRGRPAAGARCADPRHVGVRRARGRGAGRARAPPPEPRSRAPASTWACCRRRPAASPRPPRSSSERPASSRHFRRLQYSLGVSWFNAQQPRQGRGAAVARARGDARATRTCAGCSRSRRSSADEPAKAAELLADRPRTRGRPVASVRLRARARRAAAAWPRRSRCSGA